jgi:hypothetical protein
MASGYTFLLLPAVLASGIIASFIPSHFTKAVLHITQQSRQPPLNLEVSEIQIKSAFLSLLSGQHIKSESHS